MFWCIRATKSVSPEFRRSCKVVFRSSFADQDGWDAEKLWNSVESHQITKFFVGKCARNKKLNMKWIEIALKYCTFTLISSLERKRKCKKKCKILNCPSHPLF